MSTGRMLPAQCLFLGVCWSALIPVAYAVRWNHGADQAGTDDMLLDEDLQSAGAPNVSARLPRSHDVESSADTGAGLLQTRGADLADTGGVLLGSSREADALGAGAAEGPLPGGRGVPTGDAVWIASHQCGPIGSFSAAYTPRPGGCSDADYALCPMCRRLCRHSPPGGCPRCVLGRGGFGKVSRIRSNDGTEWAVKEPRGGKPLRLPPKREIWVQKLNLPFMGWIREFYTDRMTSDWKVVTPLYEGGDLGAHKDLGRDPEHFRTVAAQVAYALWELHQHGIIHRDLKPANVMFRDKGGWNLVLIDFGLAKPGCDSQHALRTGCSTSVMGTTYYMSPRMLLHKEYSYEVDWWAYGVMLFQLQAGKFPFGADAERTTAIYQDIKGTPPDFQDLQRTGDDEAGSMDGFHALLVDLISDKDQKGLRAKRPEMQGPAPEDHPILGHDFWLGGRRGETAEERKQMLRKFWEDVCVTYAKPTKPGEPAKKCRRSSDSTVHSLYAYGAAGGQSNCAGGQAAPAARHGDTEFVTPGARGVVRAATPTTHVCCCKRKPCVRSNGLIQAFGDNGQLAKEHRYPDAAAACCKWKSECTGGSWGVLSKLMGHGYKHRNLDNLCSYTGP